EDAAVRVDTTGRSIEDALDDVLVALAETGHLALNRAETDNSIDDAFPTEVAPKDPLKVLFVCTANICRSAYAEVAARRLLGDRTDLEFTSAGTHGHDGEPLNAEMA